LDSQISPKDLYYLEDEDLARQLVELGYRGSGETLKREEFEARKKLAESSRFQKTKYGGASVGGQKNNKKLKKVVYMFEQSITRTLETAAF
jgi:hypothetical protein